MWIFGPPFILFDPGSLDVFVLDQVLQKTSLATAKVQNPGSRFDPGSDQVQVKAHYLTGQFH